MKRLHFGNLYIPHIRTSGIKYTFHHEYIFQISGNEDIRRFYPVLSVSKAIFYWRNFIVDKPTELIINHTAIINSYVYDKIH
jgi:hypothetical protein